MEKLYKIILPFLFLLLVSTIGFSLYYSRTIDKAILSSEGGMLPSSKIPSYHFFAILPNSDEPYLKDMVKGLKEAAANNGVALEINYINNVNEYDDTIRLLSIGITSKVNGIITQGYNKPEFLQLVHEAEKRNIPIVSLDASVPQSDMAAYVGTNGFEMGYKEGNLVVQASKGHAKVAMVLEDMDSYGNVKMEGFKDAIKDYRDIQIVTTKISEPGILGTHNITQEILNKFPEVNTIVCTTSKDTIGVAQLVVDFNKVADVSIIGYDSTPEILSYIQKGIIYGTIVPDAYAIGKNSISFLVDVKNNGRASNYIDAGSAVITQKNVDEYIRKLASERGTTNK